MSTKFRNKYKIESRRLKSWNYGWNASYFITINLRDRNDWVFGRIENQRMILSKIGQIANDNWKNIPQHFPLVKLDVFQIMPDHVHGIIIIEKPYGKADEIEKNKKLTLEEKLNNEEIMASNKKMSEISPSQGSLGAIVRSYKSSVTKEARKMYPNFQWQSNYDDRIIWQKEDLFRIRDYIRNNPKNWVRD